METQKCHLKALLQFSRAICPKITSQVYSVVQNIEGKIYTKQIWINFALQWIEDRNEEKGEFTYVLKGRKKSK